VLEGNAEKREEKEMKVMFSTLGNMLNAPFDVEGHWV